MGQSTKIRTNTTTEVLNTEIWSEERSRGLNILVELMWNKGKPTDYL